MTCTAYSCQLMAPTQAEAQRSRLSKATVVERALALADADGLDALTIRRLAQELGVTPMALYWHFRSKEELLAGLGDQIWGEIDTDVDPDAPWPAQLRAHHGIPGRGAARPPERVRAADHRGEEQQPGGAGGHRGRAGGAAPRAASTPGTPARSPATGCGPG